DHRLDVAVTDTPRTVVGGNPGVNVRVHGGPELGFDPGSACLLQRPLVQRANLERSHRARPHFTVDGDVHVVLVPAGARPGVNGGQRARLAIHDPDDARTDRGVHVGGGGGVGAHRVLLRESRCGVWGDA